ncbi:MAG TPA: FGGY family carbohydrate kinase, partial [Candidatus Limnocylindrales bacterium]
IRTPHPGWAEQDAGAWRSAALSALRALVGELGWGSRVRSIGLTGQCPSVVLVDAKGRPVSAGLMYRDNRAAAEAAELRARFGAEALHRRTGHLAAGFHIAPKLLWLRRHQPAVFDHAAWLLQPRDVVALALTGTAATDGSHAAATLLFDLRAGDWDAGLVEALGLDPAILPPVLPSAAILGDVRASIARRLGLPDGVPVVIGGADSQACALGAGVVEPGPVSEMAGSSTCLNAVVAEPLPVVEITHYPHVVPGWFTTETGLNTTGAAVAWLADLVYGGRRRRARGDDYATLDREAREVPPGADGVLVLAVLADGERTDPDLRAAFTGLSLRHDRRVLARAVLEGAALAMRAQLELLARAGAPPTELRVSGGDSRLAAWNRIKADVTGLVVRTVPGDAASAGVAMLAGLGAGLYRDVADALRSCVRPDPPIAPDPGAADRYDEVYARYLELASSPVVRRPTDSES